MDNRQTRTCCFVVQDFFTGIRGGDLLARCHLFGTNPPAPQIDQNNSQNTNQMSMDMDCWSSLGRRHPRCHLHHLAGSPSSHPCWKAAVVHTVPGLCTTRLAGGGQGGETLSILECFSPIYIHILYLNNMYIYMCLCSFALSLSLTHIYIYLYICVCYTDTNV